MEHRTVTLRPTDPHAQELAEHTGLVERFAQIRRDLEVPEGFPEDVLLEAKACAAAPLDLPQRNATAIPFVTIDPPGSMDLDQALHIERDGSGHRVRYAIAYLPAFVAPGGAIDAEARRRGMTIYCPDERAPLHPAVFSEGPASLLPDQITPAYVWDLRLDDSGEVTDIDVERAMVRSVERYTYTEAQAQIDAGQARETLLLLKEVGERRVALELARGGATLPMPDQEVTETADGVFKLAYRPLLPAEDWNAQISLMTGMAAATLMMRAQIGILRTLPPPENGTMDKFRRQVQALGVEWPADMPYSAFLHSLDHHDPRHLAIIHDATQLFRGAGYTPFEGDVPEQPYHAALAATYAHVTAPLRRLVDRFGLIISEAVCRGEEVPTWVREALPLLPEFMANGDRKARAVERACVEAMEAAVLADRIGEEFEAVVVDVTEKKDSMIHLTEPAVIAKAYGEAELGSAVRVRLTEADRATGRVRFEVLGRVDG